MERSLTQCHEDNKQLVESLETVTASNQELKEILESVRAQLEKKTREVNALSEARGTWEVTMQQLQGEVNQLQTQLLLMENSSSSTDASMVIRLETAVAHYQTENSRLLESAAHARASLKDCTTRNQDLERCMEEMTVACNQTVKERDRLQQDVLEMRKQLNSNEFQYSSLQRKKSKLVEQLEHLNSRYITAEAVNHQLENQLSIAEKQISKLNREILALKGQLSNARRSQDKAEKQLQVTRSQGITAKSTTEDPSKLKRDLDILAGAHLNSEQIIRRQNDELERVKTAKALVEQQYEAFVIKKDKELMELKIVSEQQTADAAKKASLASAQLEEAKETYKTTLSQLRRELNSARRCQASLEKKTSMQKEELERVRGKSKEQTRKAQQAVQICRLTIHRLASQAEIDQASVGENLARMHSQLQLERDLALSSAQKYEQLKVSSTSRCKELAEEVAHLKSSLTPVDMSTPTLS
jgi:predicted  nucleic acid-binding Zn-ribbon protein